MFRPVALAMMTVLLLFTPPAPALVLGGLNLAGAAMVAAVTWRPHQEGNDWFIRSGDSTIKMPDEKTAKRTAKKFNRIEEKGVMADENSPCADPTSGVRC